MKHDIAVVTSHKTKQCDKFSFSTMSVTICDDPLVMSVTFVTRHYKDVCHICDEVLLKCPSRSVMDRSQGVSHGLCWVAFRMSVTICARSL